jgi:DNA polymerase
VVRDGSPDMAMMVEAAFDWWRDAGVDCDFADEPHDWLAQARAKTAPTKAQARPAASATIAPSVVERPRIGGDRALWPKTLADWNPWWLNEPTLAIAPGAVRVAPTGAESADVMVLVSMPEEGDSQGLLEGRGGRLLDAMLASVGVDRSHVYLASALPARITMPDWSDLATQGLGAVLAHHIALAKPRRLLVLGRSGVSTLLGNDLPNKAAHLRSFNHDSGSVLTALVYDLEAMLAKPAFKGGTWNSLLELFEARLDGE